MTAQQPVEHRGAARSGTRSADQLAYLGISFGLLAIVAFRSFVRGETSWDLLALVVVVGVGASAYDWARDERQPRGLWAYVLAIGAAVVVALAVAVVARPG